MEISVKSGSFGYKKGETLLKNVNFSVKSGEIAAVLGKNGAGKTTLLRCIMGFLRWNEGQSLLDGADIRQLSPRELWRKIGYVPQAKNTAAPYTVLETIMLGRSSRIGVFAQPSAHDYELAEGVMKRLCIESLAHKKCSEISGGELQMVLIAKALAAEPQVLILDEPESNLDFRNQLLVLDTMSELAADGMTCVFNTHYPAHALRRASKALLFCGGETLFGDTGDIVTEENLERAFGVRAVIGEIETPTHVMREIIPLHPVEGEQSGSAEKPDSRALAVIAIIADSNVVGESINQLLHRYSRYLVGRMGMPLHDEGIYVINVTIDAPRSEIRRLTDSLALLRGVSVKATYSSYCEKKELIP